MKQLNILCKKRSQDISSSLPDISRDSLRKKTQRAKKIYKLFERVGIEKVKYIRSYSAYEISKFTNDEIQEIIDYFIEKPNIDFTNDHDSSIDPEEVFEDVEEEKIPDQRVESSKNETTSNESVQLTMMGLKKVLR